MDNEKDIDAITKSDAIDILDRIIGFTNNCDNKASIILGIFGAIITIFFTCNGSSEIIKIIEVSLQTKCFCDLVYVALLFGSILIFAFGLFKLISVLFAVTNCDNLKQELLDLDSKIYFGTIAKNKSFKQYKDKLLSHETDILNDIISQIYINADICNIKFKKYKCGLKFSFIGFFSTIVLWIVGIILF